MPRQELQGFCLWLGPLCVVKESGLDHEGPKQRMLCPLQQTECPVQVQEQAKEARPGETIYKGHHSYDLMRQLQLGILFSIAKTPELRSQMQTRGDQPSPGDYKYQASPQAYKAGLCFGYRALIWVQGQHNTWQHGSSCGCHG